MSSRYPYAPLLEVRPAMLSNAAFKAGCLALPPRDEQADQAYQVMADLEERLTLDFDEVSA